MSQCQLCLSTEDVNLLDEEFVPILVKVCELSPDSSYLVCMDCTIFLFQIKIFTEKVQAASETLKNSRKEDVPESYLDQQQESCYEEEITMEDSPTKSSPQTKGNSSISEEELFTFKCHMCDAPEFLKFFQLSTHTRSKHGCAPKVKCYCDKTLSTLRGLQRHRAKHFPRETDYHCDECQLTFRTQKGLENHLTTKVHGSDKPKFICSECGNSFCNAKVLARHELTHKLPPEARRNFECPECGRKFISNDAKKNHFAKFHDKVLSFFCDVCTKGFYSRKSLVSHLLSHKPHDSISCDLCNGTFKTEKYMQKHRKSHFASSLGELVCDICHKKFRKKSQIKLHMTLHDSTCAHVCTICDKSFKKKCYLRIHTSTHTGEKKYRCMFCQRSFADLGNCRKHKLRDHPEELAKHESKYGKKGVSLMCFT